MRKKMSDYDEFLEANYLKKGYTYSDAGSLLIGDEDFGLYIDNGWGDGRNTVYVLKEEVFKELEEKFDLGKHDRYIGRVCGRFKIYKHDCCNSHKERSNTKNVKINIKKGIYDIHKKYGYFIFVEVSE